VKIINPEFTKIPINDIKSRILYQTPLNLRYVLPILAAPDGIGR
jgi:hypothetical protein